MSNKIIIKSSFSEKLFLIFNNLFLLFLCICILYPIWYVFIVSINAAGDTTRGGIFLLPRVLTLENYKVIFRYPPIYGAYTISLLRVIVGVSLQLIVCSMAAYAVTREGIIFRKFFITFFLITMFFSGGLVPLYLVLNSLKLIDTFWVFVVVECFAAWNLIIMKSFFKSTISESLIESAQLDGAGHFKIFTSIVVPLSKPLFATMALFGAVYYWNDWFYGAYFIKSDKLLPMQSYLQRILKGSMDAMLKGAMSTWGDIGILQINSKSLTMAAVIASVVPILIVYPMVQKYFVTGIMLGAVKE